MKSATSTNEVSHETSKATEQPKDPFAPKGKKPEECPGHNEGHEAKEGAYIDGETQNEQ